MIQNHLYVVVFHIRYSICSWSILCTISIECQFVSSNNYSNKHINNEWNMHIACTKLGSDYIDLNLTNWKVSVWSTVLTVTQIRSTWIANGWWSMLLVSFMQLWIDRWMRRCVGSESIRRRLSTSAKIATLPWTSFFRS